MAEAKTRDRPGVYRTFTEPFLLRLSEEQRKRVERAARARSKSISDFMRDAVMTYTVGVEDEAESRKRIRAEESARAFVPQNVRSSRGLGLRPPPAPVEPVSPPPAPSPTIVIHNAPSGSPPRDEVDALADYVLASRNTVDGEERKRVVTNILLAARTPEDRARLAKALDVRIAEKTPEKSKKSGWDFLTGGRVL